MEVSIIIFKFELNESLHTRTHTHGLLTKPVSQINSTKYIFLILPNIKEQMIPMIEKFLKTVENERTLFFEVSIL